MFSLNSCPIDRQQVEFFGVSARNTGTYAEDDRGEKYPVIERNRWAVCSTCGNHFKYDDMGLLIETRSKFTKDELDKLFPTTREERTHASKKSAKAG